MSRGVAFAATVPLTIVVARYLGALGKGQWTLAKLIAVVGAGVLGFGLHAYVQYAAAREEAGGRDAVVLAGVVGAVAVAVTAPLAFVFMPWVTEVVLRGSSALVVWTGIAGLGLTVAQQLLVAFLFGRQSYGPGAAVSGGLLVGQFVLVGGLAAFGRLDVGSALAAWLTTLVVSDCVLSGLALRARGGGQAGVRVLLARGSGYGLRAWLNSIVNMLNNRQDMFLVAYFVGTAAVGVYSIAVTACEVFWFLPDSIAGTLTSRSAEDPRSAGPLAARLSRFLVAVLVVAGVPMIVAAAGLVGPVFGAEFRAASTAMLLLFPGIVSMSVGRVLGAYFSGCGWPQESLRGSAVNLCVNVIGNLFAIPIWGVWGAAAVSSVSYTAGAWVMVARFLRRTGLGLRDVLLPHPGDGRLFWGLVMNAIGKRPLEGRTAVLAEPGHRSP